mgnify:FL=1
MIFRTIIDISTKSKKIGSNLKRKIDKTNKGNHIQSQKALIPLKGILNVGMVEIELFSGPDRTWLSNPKKIHTTTIKGI